MTVGDRPAEFRARDADGHDVAAVRRFSRLRSCLRLFPQLPLPVRLVGTEPEECSPFPTEALPTGRATSTPKPSSSCSGLRCRGPGATGPMASGGPGRGGGPQRTAPWSAPLRSPADSKPLTHLRTRVGTRSAAPDGPAKSHGMHPWTHQIAARPHSGLGESGQSAGSRPGKNGTVQSVQHGRPRDRVPTCPRAPRRPARIVNRCPTVRPGRKCGLRALCGSPNRLTAYQIA